MASPIVARVATSRADAFAGTRKVHSPLGKHGTANWHPTGAALVVGLWFTRVPGRPGPGARPGVAGTSDAVSRSSGARARG